MGGGAAGFFFTPQNITVVIGVNNTVRWANIGSGGVAVPHTVTSTIGTSPKFDSGNMVPGATFTCSFTTPGTYNYYCLYHPEMVGRIVVKSP